MLLRNDEPAHNGPSAQFTGMRLPGRDFRRASHGWGRRYQTVGTQTVPLSGRGRTHHPSSTSQSRPSPLPRPAVRREAPGRCRGSPGPLSHPLAPPPLSARGPPADPPLRHPEGEEGGGQRCSTARVRCGRPRSRAAPGPPPPRPGPAAAPSRQRHPLRRQLARPIRRGGCPLTDSARSPIGVATLVGGATVQAGSAITAYWAGPGRGPVGGAWRGYLRRRGGAGPLSRRSAAGGGGGSARCGGRSRGSLHACARRRRVPSRLSQRLPGRRCCSSSSSSPVAPCVSSEGFLRVPWPVRGGGRHSGPRRVPPRSRPGVCGASLWMRPRSPGREAARGKRCLRGFTAAWHSDPRRRRPLPRGARRRPGSAAVPGRRHGREVPARADGGEGLPGPVLHPRPAAGQPRWGPARAERGRFVPWRGRAGSVEPELAAAAEDARGKVYSSFRSACCVLSCCCSPAPAAAASCPSLGCAERSGLCPGRSLPAAVRGASRAAPPAGRASPRTAADARLPSQMSSPSEEFFYSSEGAFARYCSSCTLFQVELWCRTAGVSSALLGLQAGENPRRFSCFTLLTRNSLLSRCVSLFKRIPPPASFPRNFRLCS